MIHSIVDKIRGWWNKMFDYNKIAKDFDLDIQTSQDILDAVQEWAKIYNKSEPWIDKDTTSLHVAKTISEKIAETAVVEFKSKCDEPYVDKIYQNFLKDIQKDVELMVGKAFIFFKPYYDGKNIKINTVQADKFIPVSFSDDGKLLSFIVIDQITKESNVYTRLEFNELKNEQLHIKNIAYKGKKNGTILSNKISLQYVDEWKDIEEETWIDGLDRIIGGFATTPEVNTLDNSSPIGMPMWYNAKDTLKEIDKQFSRTLWEYEGTELAIDVDETVLKPDDKGNFKAPKGKERLFRKLNFDETKDKSYNVFSPEIRNTALFDGLNEYLIRAEVQCHLEYGTLAKIDEVEKTATEIKTKKQGYHTTIKNVQKSMQNAFDDLIYGIYALCKLYGISVRHTYTTEYDWDDSILVDKDSQRNQAMLERNNGITSDVQYVMETRNMKEKEAIEFVKRQVEYRKLTEKTEDNVPEGD